MTICFRFLCFVYVRMFACVEKFYFKDIVMEKAQVQDLVRRKSSRLTIAKSTGKCYIIILFDYSGDYSWHG